MLSSEGKGPRARCVYVRSRADTDNLLLLLLLLQTLSLWREAPCLRYPLSFSFTVLAPPICIYIYIYICRANSSSDNTYVAWSFEKIVEKRSLSSQSSIVPRMFEPNRKGRSERSISLLFNPVCRLPRGCREVSVRWIGFFALNQARGKGVGFTNDG